MKRYDAIIIGAGHNGLTAAAYLAKLVWMSSCWKRTITSGVLRSLGRCTRAGSTRVVLRLLNDAAIDSSRSGSHPTWAYCWSLIWAR
ncbi:MAG: hypothetical protein CM15mP84_11200 [Cellvibrionales bacterium]|nr:MAG: hypothetical protein CM15mP84_11200 [Cellvibrionales bacterium]